MKILKTLKNIGEFIENIFATEHSCMGCAKEIPDGTDFQLCDRCLDEIEFIGDMVCTKCGDRLDGTLHCNACDGFDYHFDSNRSVCYYGQVSASIIKALKYDSRKYYAKHIAKLLAKDRSVFENIDVITFVPMSNKRRRVRGFNQAEEIAKEVALLVKIPVVELIKKVKDDGKNQAKSTQKERLENLKGTFELTDNAKVEIFKKRVLIIDDVFTTGATLSECAKILKTEKPSEVHTLTFAKTKAISIK